MNTRLKVGKGVTGLINYALGEGRDHETMKLKPDPAPGEKGRVEWISGVNLPFEVNNREDAHLARRIMEFDASNQRSPTRKVEKDCLHLSVAWRPGETPTKEDMHEAAHSALKALGMGNAKAVFVAHNDEDYAHVHIIASKINPETDRAYDLKGSWRTLSAWAQDYELAHGGIINQRRADANELRQAIADRDAGAVLEAMTRQRSTFTPKQLESALRKELKNETARAEFTEVILSRPEAVALSDEPGGPVTRYSTHEVLEAERYVLRAADGLLQDKRHAVGPETLCEVLGREKFAKMTAEQERAVRHVTGKEGLALIDGKSGTGKSSQPVAAAREAYEAAGRTVIGLAPTHAVAQDMQRDGFGRSATVHKELFDLNAGRQRWNRNTVIILDEAAMVDTKTDRHAHRARRGSRRETHHGGRRSPVIQHRSRGHVRRP